MSYGEVWNGVSEDDRHQKESNYSFLAAAGAFAWQEGPAFQALLQRLFMNLKLNGYTIKMQSNL